MRREKRNGINVAVDDLEDRVEVVHLNAVYLDVVYLFATYHLRRSPLSALTTEHAYYTTPETRAWSEEYSSNPSARRYLARVRRIEPQSSSYNPPKEQPWQLPVDKLLEEHWRRLRGVLAISMVWEAWVGKFCGLDEEYFHQQRPLLPEAVIAGYLQMKSIMERKVYFPTEKFVKELCDRLEEAG